MSKNKAMMKEIMDTKDSMESIRFLPVSIRQDGKGMFLNNTRATYPEQKRHWIMEGGTGRPLITEWFLLRYKAGEIEFMKLDNPYMTGEGENMEGRDG